MKNPVEWFEIATVDLERAKRFYSNVFNLEFQFVEMPGSRMYMFGEPGKEGASGALVDSDGSKPGTEGTIVYFSCENISEQLEHAEKEGGEVLLPKTDIGESGFFAQIIDTEGNRIGLISQK